MGKTVNWILSFCLADDMCNRVPQHPKEQGWTYRNRKYDTKYTESQNLTYLPYNLWTTGLLSMRNAVNQSWKSILCIAEFSDACKIFLGLRKPHSPEFQGHCNCKRHGKGSMALPQHYFLHTSLHGTSFTRMWILLLCLGFRLCLGWGLRKLKSPELQRYFNSKRNVWKEECWGSILLSLACLLQLQWAWIPGLWGFLNPNPCQSMQCPWQGNAAALYMHILLGKVL